MDGDELIIYQTQLRGLFHFIRSFFVDSFAEVHAQRQRVGMLMVRDDAGKVAFQPQGVRDPHSQRSQWKAFAEAVVPGVVVHDRSHPGDEVL